MWESFEELRSLLYLLIRKEVGVVDEAGFCIVFCFRNGFGFYFCLIIEKLRKEFKERNDNICVFKICFKL